MKKFLAICALMLAGVPVAAQTLNSGDVFYCMSNQIVESGERTNWKLTEYGTQKFKIKITRENVNFSGDGFFKNEIMDVSFFAANLLKADYKKIGRMALILNTQTAAKFTYGLTGLTGFIAMTADCDRF